MQPIDSLIFLTNSEILIHKFAVCLIRWILLGCHRAASPIGNVMPNGSFHDLMPSSSVRKNEKRYPSECCYFVHLLPSYFPFHMSDFTIRHIHFNSFFSPSLLLSSFQFGNRASFKLLLSLTRERYMHAFVIMTESRRGRIQE